MEVTIKCLNLNKCPQGSLLKEFIFLGNENPTVVLNNFVSKELEKREYFEFVDHNMDNPWTRIIITDIESLEKCEMIVENRKFDLFTLHDDGKIQVFFLSYSDDKDERPYPILELALIQLANRRGYNAFIDSELQDIWSRLVVFRLNDIPQTRLNFLL